MLGPYGKLAYIRPAVKAFAHPYRVCFFVVVYVPSYYGYDVYVYVYRILVFFFFYIQKKSAFSISHPHCIVVCKNKVYIRVYGIYIWPFLCQFLHPLTNFFPSLSVVEI